MAEVLRERPKGLVQIGNVMSNFDNEIDATVADRIKNEPVYAGYVALNFYGEVWWDKDAETYRCKILQYTFHVDTISGSLAQIMSEASGKYGVD